MKLTLRPLALLSASLIAATASLAEPLTPVDYVSTLVGTDSKFELSTGNTYPAIAMPWGMNFWTPQTGANGDGWQYSYGANRIRGFKQTHQPSPWINDYGCFSIMPMTGKAILDQEARGSWFSHKAEDARPYYYKVYLADFDVVVEMAPTERACIFRITYPEAKNAAFVVDAIRGEVTAKSADKILGTSNFNNGGVPENFRNYFVVESSKPFAVVDKNDQQIGVVFSTKAREQVTLKVASSFISHEQAERNLKELDGKSFDQVVAQGRARWNEVLGRIEIEDANEAHLRTFYSCFYRSVLFPRGFYEYGADGKPVHYSPYNGKVLPGYLFTDTGFWDTFRSLFPFVNLLFPDEAVKMQEGLVNTYLESDFLPEWASPGHRGCMVGNNSASVVADAYIKGIRGYDAEALWKAVVHGTTNLNHIRLQIFCINTIFAQGLLLGLRFHKCYLRIMLKWQIDTLISHLEN